MGSSTTNRRPPRKSTPPARLNGGTELALPLKGPIEFAAAVAHDMRGPLTTIATSAELLEQELQPDDSTHLITVIQRQAQRLQNMIQDLVEYANLESGEIRLHPAVVDLTDLVREICKEYQEFQPTHRLMVELPASGLKVRADRDKLRRMLENLLNNAFKYSPRGSTVLARLRMPDSAHPEVALEVEDEGPGIPEEMRTVVFKPFVRLAGANGGGQGLGLHIVKSLAEAHGGRAWVESGAADGARFCIALPATDEGH
ncbi:MAG: HAMP domain-containing sensor histidine kinase [Dehalococcoidia bacterium]